MSPSPAIGARPGTVVPARPLSIADQLRYRMEQLDVSVAQLADRVGVSDQTVRYWLNGRSFPVKTKAPLVEQALSMRLDFSEGKTAPGITMPEQVSRDDLEAFMLLQRLSPKMRNALVTVVREILTGTPRSPV